MGFSLVSQSKSRHRTHKAFFLHCRLLSFDVCEMLSLDGGLQVFSLFLK